MSTSVIPETQIEVCSQDGSIYNAEVSEDGNGWIATIHENFYDRKFARQMARKIRAQSNVRWVRLANMAGGTVR